MINVEIVDKWNDYLGLFPENRKDIYFLEEYVKLYETDEKTAVCIIAHENSKVILFPFLQCEIDGYYDIETAYGYGGPIVNTDDIEWIKRGLMLMRKYLCDAKYLCALIRFHPVLCNEKIFSDIPNFETKVYFDRKTVSIDVSENEEKIWSDQISSKNRNMIRKAQKSGLEYKSDFEMESMGDFIELYRKTMKRLNADDFYFFNNEYFDEIIKELKGKVFLGTVQKGQKVVCAALFLHTDYYGHYHLSGSDKDNHEPGANNLLLWGAACELHRLGVRSFHLGGGYDRSEDNSLYSFKKTFSKKIHSFYIGKDVFDKKAYKSICDKWKEDNSSKVSTYGDRILMYRY